MGLPLADLAVDRPFKVETANNNSYAWGAEPCFACGSAGESSPEYSGHKHPSRRTHGPWP